MYNLFYNNTEYTLSNLYLNGAAISGYLNGEFTGTQAFKIYAPGNSFQRPLVFSSHPEGAVSEESLLGIKAFRYYNDSTQYYAEPLYNSLSYEIVNLFYYNTNINLDNTFDLLDPNGVRTLKFTNCNITGNVVVPVLQTNLIDMYSNQPGVTGSVYEQLNRSFVSINHAFYKSGVTGIATFGTNLTVDANQAFAYSNITDIDIDDNFSGLCYGAFSHCSRLDEVDIHMPKSRDLTHMYSYCTNLHREKSILNEYTVACQQNISQYTGAMFSNCGCLNTTGFILQNSIYADRMFVNSNPWFVVLENLTRSSLEFVKTGNLFLSSSAVSTVFSQKCPDLYGNIAGSYAADTTMAQVIGHDCLNVFDNSNSYKSYADRDYLNIVYKYRYLVRLGSNTLNVYSVSAIK